MGTTNGGESGNVFTGIRLRKDQKDWLEARHTNVSALIRDLLDEYIAREDAPRRDAEHEEPQAVAP